MRRPVLEVLDTRVILADGAMGSTLFELGVDQGRCFDLLSVESPDLVARIHTGYILAGAELIETNTFGANAYKLERFDLAGRVREINRAGAELARKCAGPDIWVAGAMGPLGRMREEAPDEAEIARMYVEQAEALAEGGVDLLILETFANLQTLLVALKAVKKAVDLPVAAQMVFTQRGKSHTGRTPGDCFQAMLDQGADIVGLNCGIGPHGALDVLRTLHLPPCRLSVMPNAGFPEKLGDRLIYGSSPEYFARITAQCASHGARLLGGCCGTGDAHIRALKQALASLESPGKTCVPGLTISSPAPAGSGDQQSRQPGEPSEFCKKLGSKKMILVELDPPKHLDLEPLLQGAATLKAAGVDAITIAENPLAIPRLSNISTAQHIRQATGAETIIHMTGRDRNLVGLQSTIMGLASHGLLNVLAITGDPPTKGAEENVTGVFDVQSFGLMSLLQGFNQGKNYYGDDMKKPVQFCIGGAFNPNTKNIGLQVKRLQRKIDCGARYFLTQPVYSQERVDRLLEATKDIKVPIFLGIMPLASHRNAEFLHNEFPGIDIPDPIRERMRLAGDAGMREGVAIARELLEYAWPHIAGAYIIPPFNRYQMAVDLMQGLG